MARVSPLPSIWLRPLKKNMSSSDKWLLTPTRGKHSLKQTLTKPKTHTTNNNKQKTHLKQMEAKPTPGALQPFPAPWAFGFFSCVALLPAVEASRQVPWALNASYPPKSMEALLLTRPPCKKYFLLFLFTSWGFKYGKHRNSYQPKGSSPKIRCPIAV